MTNFHALLPTSSRYNQVHYVSTNSHTHLIEWKEHTIIDSSCARHRKNWIRLD